MDPEKSGWSQSQKAIEAIKQGGFKGQGMGRRDFKRESSRGTYRLYYCSY